MSLGESLITWNHSRPIHWPWVGEKDPYRILLSEFLLQQTRSAQAVGYYKRMLDVFPTIEKLANAEEDQLMREWQGLGYYSRARNLHKTAKCIVSQHDAKVPTSYDELLTLPGIGPYTAAAISSFAFGEPRAVVDGNVYRVLARLYEVDTPINSAPARKQFTEIAQKLLSTSSPAAFNQAIMNLGAQVCIPKNPLCDACPWQSDCSAFASGVQHDFPIKKKKKPNVDRYFHFFDLTYRGKTIIEKREHGDIWQGLYQFPLIEANGSRALTNKKILVFLSSCFLIDQFDLQEITKSQRQTLSHQHIHSRFYQVAVAQKPDIQQKKYKMIFRKNLATFAFPRSVTLYLHSK